MSRLNEKRRMKSGGFQIPYKLASKCNRQTYLEVLPASELILFVSCPSYDSFDLIRHHLPTTGKTLAQQLDF